MKPLKANSFVLKEQLLINKFIDQKFENLGVIGGGSYGEVYKVRHKETKKNTQSKSTKKYSPIVSLRYVPCVRSPFCAESTMIKSSKFMTFFRPKI